MIAPRVAPPELSLEQANARLSANGADIDALMAKGDHVFLEGDHRAAVSFYSAAMRVIASKPTRDATTLAVHARAAEMVNWCAQQFQKHLFDTLDAAGFGEGKRHPRFQASLEMMLGQAQRPPAFERFPQQPMGHYYPEMPYFAFANPAHFSWVPEVESRFQAMRAEALTVLADLHGFVPYSRSDARRPSNNHHGLLDNPDWSSFYLWREGQAVEENAARCPVIFRTIMDHVPLCDIGPRAPTVLLSLLRAGARIPPHSGMLNSRLICHLPLVVPPGCGFRVGEQTISWQEGKVIIFDDSVEHEAWNNSAHDRLVVIFDIWRPELEPREQGAIKTLFAAVDGY